MTIRDPARPPMSRRDLISLIGAAAGGTAAYQAMTSLGFAAPSPYRGPIRLEGDPKGASVVVLGAGLAGMTAAIELRRAGYRVRILEYNARAGGRNWSIRGGDAYVELGGATQICGFDEGHYLNPGPWRIPYHHHALLDYCRRFGVALEPFVQLNHNAYLHATTAFGGVPQRIRGGQGRFRRRDRRTARQGDAPGRARRGGLEARTRKSCSRRCAASAVSTKTSAIALGEESAEFRGYAKRSRRRPERARRCTASRSACTKF